MHRCQGSAIGTTSFAARCCGTSISGALTRSVWCRAGSASTSIASGTSCPQTPRGSMKTRGSTLLPCTHGRMRCTMPSSSLEHSARTQLTTRRCSPRAARSPCRCLPSVPSSFSVRTWRIICSSPPPTSRAASCPTPGTGSWRRIHRPPSSWLQISSPRAKPKEETTIQEKTMITKEKEMKISQTSRADSATQEPKSALRRLMQRLGLTFLACTLAVGATEAQQVAPPIAGVIGKVQSFTGGSLDVQTPSGVVHIDVKQPLTTYKQIPSDLSYVTSTSYVGVASTEQAAGKEVAKQIIIFPPELSGAAEGSVLTDPPGASTHSRMTNGSVFRPAVSHSHMTNGTVQKGSGTTLVVQYQDGSKTISVPANVPVVKVTPEQVTFADGDVIYAATENLPNGALVTDKILLIATAASPSNKQ